MHMADHLLSPAVGAAMCAVSLAANAYAVTKIKKDEICETKIPLIGAMGAFVFAAQMVNFPIPATGSSGHIVGGILLAAVIGCFPALLSVSAALIVQCLLFADGGLFALGCNIFNMGVIPCLIVYPLFFKPFVKRDITLVRIAIASAIAVVVSLQLGAFSVVVETQFSGIAALPFSTFALLMQPIHLAIGVIEGIITAVVLCLVYQTYPAIINSARSETAIQSGAPVSVKGVFVVFAATAILVGGILSLFASSYPDGLEWAIDKTVGITKIEFANSIAESLAPIQNAVAFMPDYSFKGASRGGFGTFTAGIIGVTLTFLLAVAFTVKKKRRGAIVSL